MIQMGTVLCVADNTGAKKVRCIKVLGGSKKKVAYVGEKIVISVLEAISSNKVKSGEVFSAVIVRSKFNINRKDGIVIRFSDNAAILLDKQGELLGSRVFGVIPREIKEAGFQKIISLAQEVT